MNVIQRETSVPANGFVDNALSGSAFEFAKGPAIVAQGITAQATGILATIQAGGVSIMEESPVLVKAGVFPSMEDDMFYQYGVIGGDRLVMRLRNTTGAAIVVRHLTQIQPAR
jgi:hypothetical protein